MSTYKYRAKKGPTDIIEGRIDAASEKEAIEKINLMGLLPVRLELDGGGSGGFKPYSISMPTEKIPGRISGREVTIVSRQLASLLKSGVPILASLGIIVDQSSNPALKIVLRSVHDAVKEGMSFSGALANFPKIFPVLFVAMIHAGEDSGSLPEVLLRISEYRLKQEEMVSRFRMAMAYPVLMGVVGLGTIIFMLTFVMPRLMRIFLTMGQRLPLPTRILISTSEFLRHNWIYIILVIAVIILILKKHSRSEAGKLSASVFKLKVPIYGSLVLKTEIARFCRTLELLMRNGISILQAINIALPVVGNEVMKKQLKLSYKELEQGGSFGRSLKNSKLFPPFMSNLLIVGEESGKLVDALSEAATTYERETDDAIKVMASLLEPLMILGMGMVVGFIVVAMLLPIFEINIGAR